MTDFQSLCYQTLKAKVPAGRVTTYAGLAKLINHPKAYRAVGSAMNKNPFAPQVPCHRVVKSNGDLGGFRQGTRVKIERLNAEGVEIVNNKIKNFEQIYLNME